MRIISGKARGTKLYTLEGENTRPTLDRVKESLFSIIQNNLQDAIVIDLFSGSGALGLECLSRGAKKAYLCDKSPMAIEIIKKNIQKTHMNNNTIVLNMDYKKSIEKINEETDIIFIDPPYKANIATDAIEIITNKKILRKNGIIVLETDDEKREIEQLKNNIKMEMYDFRTYGRVKLIFLKWKEE